MSNVLWLLVWLGFAAAAFVFTLVFVALADRSLADDGERRAVSGRSEETGQEGRDSAGDATQPQSRPRDQDSEEKRSNG